MTRLGIEKIIPSLKVDFLATAFFARTGEFSTCSERCTGLFAQSASRKLHRICRLSGKDVDVEVPIIWSADGYRCRAHGRASARCSLALQI